jgi:hypothetical protein
VGRRGGGRMGETRLHAKFCSESLKERYGFERPRHTWDDNIKLHLKYETV